MAPSKSTTTSPTTSPTTSLTTPLANLTTLHLTLHHLNHRNKNQHRLAKWYKSLSQFLRQSAKLSREIEEFDAARVLDPGYGKKDGKKEGKVRKESKFTIAARAKLVSRIEFLALGGKGDMIGRWYLAFSTLVADNQYASLGLMLIGSLARFQTVVKQVAKEIDVDLEPRELPVDEEKSGLVLLQPQTSQEASNDDLGEVISRDGFEPLKLEAHEIDERGEEEIEVEIKKISSKEKKRKDVNEDIEGVGESTLKTKRQKKKKKKGDAFDDLFGGLI